MASGALNPFEITERERVAGQEYLEALRNLGFEPSVLCWIVEQTEGDAYEKRLAVVTSLVDRMGPSTIYELLFKAYDAAATPQLIDPFIVALYSPLSIGGSILYQKTSADLVSRARSQLTQADLEKPGSIMMMPSADDARVVMQVLDRGIYVSQRQHYSAVADIRRFRVFQKRVEKLAA